MRLHLSDLRLWGVLLVLALLMTAAYVAIIRASHQAQIQEVPLARNPHGRP